MQWAGVLIHNAEGEKVRAWQKIATARPPAFPLTRCALYFACISLTLIGNTVISELKKILSQ